MSKNKSVERQKTKDKKRKPKVVKWEYVTKPFDVYVLASQVNRVHKPLITSLDTQKIRDHHLNMLHLRPCVQGVDEDGAVVKYLYCTRDGRFFVRGKDGGWSELMPAENFMRRGFRNKAGGGDYDLARMVHFGSKYCHRCVAFVWCNPPQAVIAHEYGVDWDEKWEVDHLNTDHKNWTADNLQWVTAKENCRRGKIARRMRKIGLDPKRLTPTLCKGIYSLPEERIGEFTGRFLMACNECGNPMDIWSIRMCVAIALDNVRSQMELI